MTLGRRDTVSAGNDAKPGHRRDDPLQSRFHGVAIEFDHGGGTERRPPDRFMAFEFLKRHSDENRQANAAKFMRGHNFFSELHGWQRPT